VQVVKWDLRTGDRQVVVPRGDDVHKVMHPAISHAGDLAYPPGRGVGIELIRADGTRRSLDGHTDKVSGGGFGRDGALYSASWDGSVRRWDLASGRDHVIARGAPVEWMAIAPGGDRLVLERDGVLAVMSLDGAIEHELRRAALPGQGDLGLRQFSRDGGSILLQSRDGHITRWVFATGQLIGLTTAGHHASQVAFSPDGGRIAGAMADRTVRVWDAVTGDLESTLRGHVDLVMWVEFSPDGTQLASSSYDRTIRVWSLATRQSRVLRGHAGAVETIAWAEDGAHIVSGSRDGTVRVWPTPSTKTPTPDEMRAAIAEATTAEVGANEKVATPTGSEI
jgi:WD40 repeat protein